MCLNYTFLLNILTKRAKTRESFALLQITIHLQYLDHFIHHEKIRVLFKKKSKTQEFISSLKKRKRKNKSKISFFFFLEI